jgi:hypothetical protein
MITNTGIHIKEPKVNQVVFFKPWQGKNEMRKKAYPVIIVDGQYLSNGLISNFWSWQRLTPTGRINPKVECGYGNFFQAEGYKVVRKVIYGK